LGTILTNKNSIADEIKSRLRSGNACYHSVQDLLSSKLLSRNLKIKIYRIIILPVVLYGYETWSLTLREERKLMVFENMVLRRMFGPRPRPHPATPLQLTHCLSTLNNMSHSQHPYTVNK